MLLGCQDGLMTGIAHDEDIKGYGLIKSTEPHLNDCLATTDAIKSCESELAQLETLFIDQCKDKPNCRFEFDSMDPEDPQNECWNDLSRIFVQVECTLTPENNEDKRAAGLITTCLYTLIIGLFFTTIYYLF